MGMAQVVRADARDCDATNNLAEMGIVNLGPAPPDSANENEFEMLSGLPIPC